MKLRNLLLISLLIASLVPAFASTGGHIAETQMALVLQIGIILFMVKLGGIAAQADRKSVV